MSAMETSLRRALQNGNAADPEFRLSIYQASERAMEKMLSDKGVPAAEATQRRHALADAIAQIEADYGPGDGLEAGHGDSQGDVGYADTFDDATHTGAPQDTPAYEDAPAPRRAAPVQGRSPFLSPAFLGVVAALFLVILLYIVSTVFQGGDGAQEQSGTTSSDTAATAGNLSWINVFSGGNIDVLATPQGGRVEAISLDGRDAVRMQAPEGQSGEVLLNVGPGLVGELAGSTVRVELTAGSPDSNAREFSVRCLFGLSLIHI